MNKVFVVPSIENLGIGVFYRGSNANCAVGHLHAHLGLKIEGMFCPAVAKALGIPTSAVTELMKDNDHAAPEQRREVFINWLRTHFPNQEVKS